MSTISKPKFTDAIGDFVNNQNLNTALDFINYLKTNKISTSWANTNTWKAVKKGSPVCYIKTNTENGGSWVVIPHYHNNFTGFPEKAADLVPGTLINVKPKNSAYDEIISDEKMMNIICSKISKCTDCGNKKKCVPGVKVNWWGNELDNRCKFINTVFINPDSDELQCIKTIISIFVENI